MPFPNDEIVTNSIREVFTLPVSPPAIIALVVELAAPQPLKVVFVSPKSTEIYVDKSHLNRVLTNLIKNSLQAEKKDRPIEVNIDLIKKHP